MALLGLLHAPSDDWLVRWNRLCGCWTWLGRAVHMAGRAGSDRIVRLPFRRLVGQTVRAENVRNSLWREVTNEAQCVY